MHWNKVSVTVSPEQADAIESLLWALGAVSVTFQIRKTTLFSSRQSVSTRCGSSRKCPHSLNKSLISAR